MSTSLADMPAVVIRKILEGSGFKEIENVRKTCHQFRDFIDDNGPFFKIRKFTVEIGTMCIQLRKYFENCSYYIRYNSSKRGCLLEYDDRKKLVVGNDFVELFNLDLITTLSKCNNVLDLLSIDHITKSKDTVIHRCFEGIMRAIKYRKRELKVNNLQLTVIGQNQVLKILPYLDKDFIEKVRIFEEKIDKLEIDEIVKLEQWRVLKNVFISVMILPPIFDFMHIPRVTVTFRRVSAVGMNYVKECFFSNPALIHFQINYLEGDVQPDIVHLYGQPTLENWGNRLERSRWYIKYPTGRYILSISCYTCIVAFHRMELTEVDDEVRILAKSQINLF